MLTVNQLTMHIIIFTPPQNDARNGDLPCPVMAIAFDYAINGGGGQSLSLSATDMTQSIDIADNTGTYDITVSYVNRIGFSGDTMSLRDGEDLLRKYCTEVHFQVEK